MKSVRQERNLFAVFSAVALEEDFPGISSVLVNLFLL